MQAINRLLRKIVIVYPHLFRCSTIKYHKLLSTFVERPLCCLAFHHILRCSVFKVQCSSLRLKRSIANVQASCPLAIHLQFEIGGDSRDRTWRPPACKAGALPAELYPHLSLFRLLVGPSGLEPPTLRLSVVRSSQLSYGPISTAQWRYALGIEQRTTLRASHTLQALSQLSYIPRPSDQDVRQYSLQLLQ